MLRTVDDDSVVSDALNALELTLLERATDRPAGSYSVALLDDPDRLQRKIMEEAFEVCLELGRPQLDTARVAEEAADLIYHLMVGLVRSGVPLTSVEQVLERRQQ
ncbi:MAG TPA: phosphoribosyl-ATP diphosphatase [Acidimicrobiales bacterium]|nr:phosphoribosyl-ATP diphosphatase [Acidimicrobiales bacterium]